MNLTQIKQTVLFDTQQEMKNAENYKRYDLQKKKNENKQVFEILKAMK